MDGEYPRGLGAPDRHGCGRDYYGLPGCRAEVARASCPLTLPPRSVAVSRCAAGSEFDPAPLSCWQECFRHFIR